MKTYVETNRLIMRSWSESDVEPFIQLNADDEVMEFFPNTLSQNETLSFIKKIENQFHKWGFGWFAVEHKETGLFIGFIGLSKPEFQSHFTPCVEIGWRLDKRFWNRGLATEGAKAVLELGFDQYDLEEIYSFTTTENKASESVMKKIGMRKVGSFRHPMIPEANPLCEHLLYRITR